MTVATAKKLLTLVQTLEGMISEVSAKEKFFKSIVKTCKTQTELNAVNNGLVVLGSEMDNINVTIDLVEDLHQHLAQERVAA